MKILTLTILVIFSSTTHAKTYRHECDEFKNQLSMTIGTYRFKSNSLCKETHKVAKDCQLENLKRSKLNNNSKRLDCLQILMSFMDKHKNQMTRLGDTVFQSEEQALKARSSLEP